MILTLPGSSERTILVVARRDSADGPGAATSASATAQLLGLAEALGGSRHELTLVLASTDGGTDGAEGAASWSTLPRPESIEAALVISQPGVRAAEPPFVITAGTGPDSVSPQLVQTARGGANERSSRNAIRARGPGRASPGSPSRRGSASSPPCRARASSRSRSAATASGDPAGATPPSPGDDGRRRGATMLDLILTLDQSDRAPAGPEDYVRLGDNLVPGWTLSLLAITLLLPPLLTAATPGCASSAPTGGSEATLFWAAERVLSPARRAPAHLPARVVGLVPDPSFPYDPGLYTPPAPGTDRLHPIAGAVALAALLIRPMRTPLDAEPHTLAAAAGLLTGISVLGIWLAQPLSGAAARPGRTCLAVRRPRRGPAAGPVLAVFAVALAGPGAARVRDRRRGARPRRRAALAPAVAGRDWTDRLRHVPALVRSPRRADRLRLLGGGMRARPRTTSQRCSARGHTRGRDRSGATPSALKGR